MPLVTVDFKEWEIRLEVVYLEEEQVLETPSLVLLPPQEWEVFPHLSNNSNSQA
jgi:hypothetical protein